VKTNQRLSPVDQLLVNIDRAVRTLQGAHEAARRTSPAQQAGESTLSEAEKKHAASLMRINHTGEVMAQALYQGQSLTAKLPTVRSEMEKAADEEVDHLVWCEQRIKELGSHTSLTNPLWYGVSFGMGAVAGLVGDKVSLGFVSAIEDQVCEHLESHLQKLPAQDEKSRAIVGQMLEDEAQHSRTAKAAGGMSFPMPVKKGMTLLSKLMTESSYRI
jgi:ubiquinone biosynthesis monooxygenase Coq7